MFSASPAVHEIYSAHLFEEPLIPIGDEPTPGENSELARALTGYAQRVNPEDFSHLTTFLESHANSPWNAALLTNLGLEYYRTGRYSKTLDVWRGAWELAKSATDRKGKVIADRAFGELVYMHARLGHMAELDTMLASVEGRVFTGSATEKVTGAREGLYNMRIRPEISFRCGPYALDRIMSFVEPKSPGRGLVYASESTQDGCSLTQVAELSREMGINYQMAFREKDSIFLCPSVVHFKVDHFAAIIQKQGDLYLLQDPTFGNDVWMSKDTLEAEASGYFLIPQAELKPGWRTVLAQEGESVWGRGLTAGNDPGPHGPCDPASPGGGNSCPKDGGNCKGLAVSRVHLMLVSLNINDEPLGYAPPVGPAVRFMVRYNQRDASQPSSFLYSNLGPKWTFDWLSYITDNPFNPSADLTYYIMGGGTRTFTGFGNSNSTLNSGTSAFQQLDQTLLSRTSSSSYELLSRDGSKKVFSKPDGSVTSSRKIFITSLIDPHGNSVSLGYDANLRVITITDAIGQVTTLSYDDLADKFKITKVTDPFKRFVTFDYDPSGRLITITDVIGLISQFTYDAGDFITGMTTPYGVTSFEKTEDGTTRSLDTIYPDGNRDRVEYNQSTNLGIPSSDSPRSVPGGMATRNEFLVFRNTYYWSKIAYAAAYPDYTKAKIYHWLHGLAHMPNANFTAGILESVKEPLEGRVWFDYAGQDNSPGGGGSIFIGTTNQPAHTGRVLDDGSTQLYTYFYNDFGHIVKQVDPVGRTFSYIYAANGIDLREIRQARAGQKQVLSKRAYNAQHMLLTSSDAAGQLTTYTYNARGQLLTRANAKNETTGYDYDVNGRLTSKNGPLPGASITFTYDLFSRVQTKTDESGYALTFEYDDLDRLTKISFPDGTFHQFTYTRLDPTTLTDRAGRQTSFRYDNVRQMIRRADPLNRVMLFQWCKCGELRGLTDPLGRTTSWRHDIQGRVKSKEYVDGSKVTYSYEGAMPRLRQRIDEQLQVTSYSYNLDNTLSQISYANSVVVTPSVSITYDPDYIRLHTMTDGTGVTRYEYFPIDLALSSGAGQLASVANSHPGGKITFKYDELSRLVSTIIDGVESSVVYDAGGRILSTANALGTFGDTYDGNSLRKTSQLYPNGQIAEFGYAGTRQDQHLQKITNKLGLTPISEFSYDHDVPTGQITSWSQQIDTQTSSIYSLSYDPVDQLTSASVSEKGNTVRTVGYSYDPAGNRLTEKIDATTRHFSYNALNELTSIEDDASLAATYQWDAERRLISVNAGNQETQFTYDGLGNRVAIRRLVNSAEVSDRRFLWCGDDVCEERTSKGSVVKRFFPQGLTVEAGVKVGKYFYTKDHLGSVREVNDNDGGTRARFGYDLYGVRIQISGDLDSDFGFTGHFYETSTALCLAKHRAYDPKRAHWISRDRFPLAEATMAPSLYAYAGNNPVNFVDVTGQYVAAPAVVAAGIVAGSSALGPIGLGLVLGVAGLLSALNPGPAPGPTSGTGPLGSGGGLSPAPAPGNGPAPGDSSGGPGDPYRWPDPPPPRDPANCKGVEPTLAKLSCCFFELNLPTGDVCLTPEQQQQLNKCLSQ